MISQAWISMWENREKERIERENLHLAAKLITTKSDLNRDKFSNDFKKSRRYKSLRRRGNFKSQTPKRSKFPPVKRKLIIREEEIKSDEEPILTRDNSQEKGEENKEKLNSEDKDVEGSKYELKKEIKKIKHIRKINPKKKVKVWTTNNTPTRLSPNNSFEPKNKYTYKIYKQEDDKKKKIKTKKIKNSRETPV